MTPSGAAEGRREFSASRVIRRASSADTCRPQRGGGFEDAAGVRQTRPDSHMAWMPGGRGVNSGATEADAGGGAAHGSPPHIRRREGVARGDDSLIELAERPHGTVPPMGGEDGFLLGIGFPVASRSSRPARPGFGEDRPRQGRERGQPCEAPSPARGTARAVGRGRGRRGCSPVAMYDTPGRSTAHSR